MGEFVRTFKSYTVQASHISRYVDWDASKVTFNPEGILFIDEQYHLRPGWETSSAPLPIIDKVAWHTFCDKEFYDRQPVTEIVERDQYRTHKWNTDFQWRPMRKPSRLLTDEMADFYDENGYVVLKEKVSAPVVARLIEEADRIERERQAVLSKLKNGKGFIAREDEISFTTHIVKKSEFYKNFYQSQLFADIAWDFVGDNVRLYWDQAVYKKPGVEKPFPWHQDNGYTFVTPQQFITVWIALSDVTTENGCMWFVPGVHKLGTVEHDLTDLGYAMYADNPPKNAVPVECEAGTVIVLSALCPHMTGHNRTNETRRAIISQFVADGSVQLTEENGTSRVMRGEITDEARQFAVLKNGEAVI